MNRRGFLGLFGCLPFLGFLKKEGLKVQDLLDYKDKLPPKRSGITYIGAEPNKWCGTDYKCTYFIDDKEVTPEQWKEFVWWQKSFSGTELVWTGWGL